ncbi:MAG: hypothetical protein R3E12_18485 [Candidatus Eisenbacteria bacterium]
MAASETTEPNLPSTDGRVGGVATQTLVLQARDGSEAALNALYDRLFPRLTRWTEARLPGSGARDASASQVVREVFFRSFRSGNGFLEGDAGGLVLLLQEQLEERIEEERLRNGRSVANGDPPATAAPIELLIDEGSLRRFRLAVRRLAPEQAELVLCRIEMQMSFDEIALHHGWASALDARTAFQRALLMLARTLDADE